MRTTACVLHGYHAHVVWSVCEHAQLAVVVCFRVPALLFAIWLLLYFGRPTWGALIALLPLGGGLRVREELSLPWCKFCR